ncbi:hypothetical protein H4R21_000446 [Coemansia helicoidea]|uniref:Uncharacterized protein n=1 Tax=Coemansia helicoidea TaxID=1286919 RepID=A0ACC1LH61_9FUNG|nr:hypothetical protein H4R21_000446 [Coemansia helicoidea]
MEKGQPAPAASAPAAGRDHSRDADDDCDDDDAWNKRIRRTGCFAENERLLICHADTGDWRKCADELAAFRRCMQRRGQLQ